MCDSNRDARSDADGDVPGPETAKSYPDPPDELDAESARAFVEDYEVAHYWNEILASHHDADTVVGHLELAPSRTTVAPAKDGYVANVEVEGLLLYEAASRYRTPEETPQTPTQTATALQSVPISNVGAYYVTPRFVMRDDRDDVADPPKMTGGTVLVCR